MCNQTKIERLESFIGSQPYVDALNKIILNNEQILKRDLTKVERALVADSLRVACELMMNI
ncbi:MAG: hypothetical protein ACI9TY_000327 [Alphaproteobacteria bacterium]|jgi:hypothetical protein